MAKEMNNVALETTETANKTETAKFEVGNKVYNVKNEKRFGEITEKDGVLRVSFIHESNGKPYSTEKLQDWAILTETAPKSVLDAVLQATETKDAKTDAKVTAPAPASEKKVLTETELKELKSLEKEFLTLDAKIDTCKFRQAEIINEIRNKKLYLQDFDSMEKFALARFGLTREYFMQLAQVGGFYATAKDYIGAQKISMRSVIEMIRNQNKMLAEMEIDTRQDGVNEIARPITQQLVGTTIAYAKANNNGLITKELVKQVSENVMPIIGQTMASNPKKSGVDLLALLGKRIEANQVELTKVKTETANGSNGNGSKSTGSGSVTETYKGELPTITLNCSLHALPNNKISVVGNGWFQLKCRCKFTMVGFDAEAIEVNGQKVKK